MWTPKRIVMLSGCFVAFFMAYLGYAFSALGRMDGLPPLPEAYWPQVGGPLKLTRVDKSDETPLARKIKLAFGPKCEELNRPIRLDLESRHMVLCADKFEITDKGLVKLDKLSLAMFAKEKNDGLPVEFSTISGETAWLTFDRPVSSFSEISNRKMVEAKIQNNINIRNNRRRLERDEDLHVRIPNGPLYYCDTTHFVKTEDTVFLEDHKSKPKPNTIIGKKMDMQLRTEADDGPKHNPHKTGKDSITGVDWIELKSDVQIDLYTEGKGGLVGGGPQGQQGTKTPPAATKPSATMTASTKTASTNPANIKPASTKPASASTVKTQEAEKAHVHITTPGKFRYNIFKDHDIAQFDIPDPGKVPRSPQQVVVTRTLGTNIDELVCHHLTLRLRRKESNPGEKAPAAEAKPADEGAEIETVHATGKQGVVTLKSDAEKLHAFCSDLFHDSVKGLTILKDSKEVIVHKEENDIYAQELYIQDVTPPKVLGQPEPKTYQNITAKGPGHIRMVDKEDKEKDTAAPPLRAENAKAAQPKGPKVQHAYWRDLLTFSKDNGLDLLVLTGEARFIDEQAEQSLRADKLKVWLDEEDKSKAPPANGSRSSPALPAPGTSGPNKVQSATPAIASGRKPRHVEAIGNVTARSHEANIHDTGLLVTWFKDVPNEVHMPPSAAPLAPGSASGKAPAAPDRRPAASAAPGGSGAQHKREKGSGKADEAQPSQALLSQAQPSQAQPSQAQPSQAQPSQAQPSQAQPSQAQPSQAQPMPRGPQAKQLTSKSGDKPASGPELPPANNSATPPHPFDLSARSIEVKVLRSEIKSTIDELWCEGNVAVKQDPPTATERGTDVKGDTLKMTARGPDLYYLVVTGDLADLQTDKIRIRGPEVNIDQSTNKAWVYGIGYMTMYSATNFQGDNQPDQPVPLTVQWEKSMFFNGASAEYEGNVQATQEKARLACQWMHVFFDRTISLKEGNKTDEPAKVRELVCDRDVRVDDAVYEGDVLKTIRKIRGPGLQMVALLDDDTPRPTESAARTPGKAPMGNATGKDPSAKTSAGNEVHVAGPGSVCIIERDDGDTMGMTMQPAKPAATAGVSSSNPGGGETSSKPAPPTANATNGKGTASKPANAKIGQGKDLASTELKVTYVEYARRMDANSKENMVRFWEDVRLLNMPCQNPDVEINLEAILATTLPEKALFLRCGRLQVLDHPTDGKPNKQMEAHDKVYIQGREFYARSDTATYNQQKEQVILLGGLGNPAKLYKQDAQGGKPSVVVAKKIIYTRTTGVTEAFGVESSSGDTPPKAAPTPLPATTPGVAPRMTPGTIPGTIPPR